MYSRLARSGSSPVSGLKTHQNGAQHGRHVGRLPLVVSAKLACSIHTCDKIKQKIKSHGQIIWMRGSARRPLTTCTAASGPLRALEGDIVTVHWKCLNEQGEVLESSKASDELTTFEVGAGDIVGNQLFEAFDEAVRGLAVNETIGIKAEGGDWKEELLFQVPRDHDEIQRMEGRYKNQGGVQKGLIAELSNGSMALVVDCNDEAVTLDANSMMAGKSLLFEIELIDIERS